MNQKVRTFNAAEGVKRAAFTSQPPFIRRGHSRGKFRAGIKYEAKVFEALSDYVLGEPNLELRKGPWLEFEDQSGQRWCQPDAILIDLQRRDLLVCEIKYQHISDAWWQLRHLYDPVLSVALPGFRSRLVEIVHWCDPQAPWPDSPLFVSSLRFVPYGGRVATVIYNPKRGRLC